MRCSARRSRAAATISIARVIFCTFFTLAMRFLTSLRVAISATPPQLRFRGLRESCSGAGLLLLGLGLRLRLLGTGAVRGGFGRWPLLTLAVRDPVGLAL